MRDRSVRSDGRDQRAPVARGWRTAMPKTCPQCQNETTDDANHCPSCGAALNAGAHGGPGRAASGGRPRPAPPAGRRLDRIERSRLTRSICHARPGRSHRRHRNHRAVHLALFPWFTDYKGIGGIPLTSEWALAHGWTGSSSSSACAIVAYLVCAGRMGQAADQRRTAAPDRDDRGHGGERRPRPHRLHRQAGRFGGVGWGFGAVLGLIAGVVARAPYAVPQLRAKDDVGWLRCGTARVPLAPRTTLSMHAEASLGGLSAGRRRGAGRESWPADGSASNATKRRMTS